MASNILETSKKDMQEYGEEVLRERAIPDFRDGLKPVHRRILWTCYTMGLKHSGGTKKCARIVGNALGRFHPHGDQSLYQALVGMTAVSASEPMIHGQGNFGGVEESAAAFRYTEAKLSSYAEKYLLDPDYLAVTPMVPNYDDTEKEPVYLPSKLPNLLLFGTEGIAVGCSNLVPSFSKESVVNLVKKVLKGKKVTEKLLLNTLEFKFPFGGKYSGTEEELKDYYKTGFAKLNFQCQIKKEKEDKGLFIDTLAPRIKPTKISGQIAKLKDVSGIELVKTRKSEHWFHISFRRNIEPRSVIEKIKDIVSSSLNCQTYVTERHDDGTVTFKRTSLVDLITDWVDWRIEFEKKVITRLIGIEEVQIQKLDWLIWACNNLKLVMQALESKDPDAYLVKKGGVTKEGADFILSQQVRRLAKLEIKGLKERKATHVTTFKSLKLDLKKRDRLVARVINSIDK